MRASPLGGPYPTPSKLLCPVDGNNTKNESSAHGKQCRTNMPTTQGRLFCGSMIIDDCNNTVPYYVAQTVEHLPGTEMEPDYAKFCV